MINEKKQMQKLIELGIALSTERKRDRLLERILIEAQSMTNADGGTLYLLEELASPDAGKNRRQPGLKGEERSQTILRFAIMRTESLGIARGGTTGEPITLPPLPLLDEQGRENHHNVATHVALTGQLIKIDDAYEAEGFDFSGTRGFDKANQYRSKSFLTLPLKNHQGRVIGVLQLLNARNEDTGEIISFTKSVEPMILALASQAAVALDNQRLIAAQRELLDSFIKLIANAIDQKSPYTGGHCQRVPVITEMLARAACEAKSGPFVDFQLNEDEWYELQIAAWLHDCGKVTTPEFIVDKATKLETKYDRINEVLTRFALLKRDAEIEYLRAAALPGADKKGLEQKFRQICADIDDEAEFIERTNKGGEFLSDQDVDRIHEIANRHHWIDRSGHRCPVLSENEIMNLSIRRGTLTEAERKVINDHVVVTINMLEALPFPPQLSRVPEYAGGHHERVDGKGYPNGLRGHEMSLPARMMAIADIFEALTASDRPYKHPKKLSESLEIMSRMCKDQHIDRELYELFLCSGVPEEYTKRYLREEQSDSVNLEHFIKLAGIEIKSCYLDAGK